MKLLGIETSCDETAAAVVEDGKRLLSSVVASSIDLHKVYGGVVPEIAARSHVEVIIPVIKEALDVAQVGWDDIDSIAVTEGPGLGGSLLIGVMTARSLAIARDKPLYAVNHVLAHVFAGFISESSLKGYALPEHPPAFPLLALIVSGGHTQLVLFYDYLDYEVLGRTLDDAVGEAFDKVAKIIGLPYPGGPAIDQAALKGNPSALALPAIRVPGDFNFSFSGLKTAVLRAVQQLCGKDYAFPSFRLAELLSEAQKADVAASFQRAANEELVRKTRLAFEKYQPRSVLVAGGVAANQSLRRLLVSSLACPVIYPDFKLCTDNAAMIAALAGYQAAAKLSTADPYRLTPQPALAM